MRRIAVNGKFMAAGLNGVHRTAAEFTSQLLRCAKAPGEVRLLTPPGAAGLPEFPSLQGEPLTGALDKGQWWEQVTLPRATRGSLLVNFCNLAPLSHANSIVMIHDAQTFLRPEAYPGLQGVLYRKLLPLIAQRARRVLTVSEFSKQSLAAHGIGTLDKIDVVYNGTDHILKTPADPQILAQHGLAEGSYVMVLGSPKNYKNMQVVFEAMREPLASGHRLVVAGGKGPQAYREQGWHPPAGTVFTGFVSDGELRALYEHAAVFVMPSLTEGFGLPPVEAMHCNTPVISARAGAMPEVLGDAAIFVRPNNSQEYRAAIEQVLTDPQKAADLIHRGKQRALRLSWEAAGERLWSLIEPLA